MVEKFSWIKLSYAVAGVLLTGIITVLLMSTKIPTRIDNLEKDMTMFKEGKMVNDNTKVSTKTFEIYKEEHGKVADLILTGVSATQNDVKELTKAVIELTVEVKTMKNELEKNKDLTLK